MKALTALALLVCYRPTLQGMVKQWWTDEDMSHGFAVPFVILWIVWRERGRWQAIEAQPTAWGFALLVAAAGLQAAGGLGVGLFAGSVAFLFSVAGAILCLGGFVWLRALALPLLLGLFMLPKLAIVYNQATLPLQLFASRLAAAILTSGGIGVIREGNILDVRGHRVEVAEACSGIRYLLSLGFFAVVFGYISDAKAWMRLVLLAAAVPLAIVGNALRVAAAAWRPSLDSGTAHTISGWFIFLLCLPALLGVRQLLNNIHTRYGA